MDFGMGMSPRCWRRGSYAITSLICCRRPAPTIAHEQSTATRLSVLAYCLSPHMAWVERVLNGFGEECRFVDLWGRLPTCRAGCPQLG
jgi:hypothetical protein